MKGMAGKEKKWKWGVLRLAFLLFVAAGAYANVPLDSHSVDCHRKYWDKRTGRWTYIVCVFPDGSTSLYMRVPEHSTSDPIMTPDSTRGKLELMSPGIVQIPEVDPIAPADSDDDQQEKH